MLADIPEMNVYPESEVADYLAGVTAGRNAGVQMLVNAASNRNGTHSWLNNSTAIISCNGRSILAHRYFGAESAVASALYGDKAYTKEVWDRAGVQTPRGRVVASPDEAIAFCEEIGKPIVVKPRFSFASKGVTVNLSSEQDVRDAFALAKTYNRDVLVEEFLEIATEYRCFVGNGRVHALVERLPPHVVGDGQSTIGELITHRNELRRTIPSTRNEPIEITDRVTRFLAERGKTIATIPAAGEVQQLSYMRILGEGGDLYGVLDKASSALKLLAVKAAAAIPGADWAGLDLIETGSGEVYAIEINSNAQTNGIQYPSYGQPVPIADLLLGERLQQCGPTDRDDLPEPTIGVPALTSNRDASSNSAELSAERKVRLNSLFYRWLKATGYGVTKVSRRTVEIDGPVGSRWFTNCQSEQDLEVVNIVAEKHALVRKAFRNASVPRTIGKLMPSAEALLEHLRSEGRRVAVTPHAGVWQGAEESACESAEQAPIRSGNSTKYGYYVQSVPRGTRLRIISSPTRCFAVLQKGGETVGDIDAALSVAAKAVRSIPGLRWAAVDVVIAKSENGGNRVSAEGLSLNPQVGGDYQVVYGALTDFFTYLMDEQGVDTPVADSLDSAHDEDPVRSALAGSPDVDCEDPVTSLRGPRRGLFNRRVVRKTEISVDNPAASYIMVPSSGAILSKGHRERGTVVVPPAVGGLPLLWVGRDAYAGSQIASVFFASPLASIGRAAFFECRSLTSVSFSDSIEYIGRSAFESCSALEQVRLPAKLKVIGKRAFRKCESLREVRIPGSVEDIGAEAFNGCSPSLVIQCEKGSYAHRWAESRGIKVNLTAAEDVLSMRSAALETSNGGILYQIIASASAEVKRILDSSVTRVEIPEEVGGFPVTGIGARSFTELRGLTEVTIPPSVQYIAAKAFDGCPNLRSVKGLSDVSVISLEAGLGEFLTRKSPLGQHDVDADFIRFTPRMVSRLLDVAVPSALEGRQDQIFTQLAAGELSSSAGSMYFCRTAPSGSLVRRLLQRGIVAFVAAAPVQDSEGKTVPTFLHSDPASAFEKLCSWVAEQNFAKTIAITGSIGKTTTKEMVQLVCSAGFRTVYSKGNQNGVAQVGRYIQKVSLRTEVFVQETGAAHPGLIDSDAKMLHPDAFVVTNIGLNHVGDYGGKQENILKDKMSHDKYLPEDGVAFINYDDEMLRAYPLDHQVVSYGIDSRDTDYHAESAGEADGVISFDIAEARTGKRAPAKVYSFGRYNVSNALVAFAVGRWLGVPTSKIVRAIGRYRGEGLRQNLTELGGQKVLVDCYNASETAIASTATALQTITVAHGGRRILVFADIDDKLGDMTEEVHRRVGQAIAAMDDIDLFVCFGEHAGWSAEEAQKAGAKVFHTNDRTVLDSTLRAELRPSDVVAFKGGQQMALSITIDHLFGSYFVLQDGDVLLRRGRQFVRNGLQYRRIRDYGTEIRRPVSEFSEDAVTVESEIDGSPVLMVGKLAFSGRSISSVTVPEPVCTIAQSAFFRCSALSSVVLPSTLRFIGRSAFNACVSLEELTVPEGVTTIEKRAFFGCRNLRRLELPSTVVTMGTEVFKGCDHLEITCPADSWVASHLATAWPKIKVNTF